MTIPHRADCLIETDIASLELERTIWTIYHRNIDIEVEFDKVKI